MKAYQRGFTLVELAIVLTIVGLLIGGILKGQQLITNAKVTAQISQFQALTAATTTFQDTYGALPGDILTPNTRLPNCTAAPCSTAGNGDGVVGTAAASPATYNGGAAENLNFFIHLARADLIGGVSGTAASFGSGLPTGKVASGIVVQYMNTAPYSGLYAEGLINTAAPGTTAGSNSFTPSQAAQVDRKMDDGTPNTGIVLGFGTTACNAATYTESTVTKDCALSVRIMN